MKNKKLKSSIIKAGAVLLLIASLGGCAGFGQKSVNQDDDTIASALLEAAIDAEKKNNFDAAAGHYSRLLQKNPDNYDIATALARNLRYGGNASSAVNLLSEISKRNPENVEINMEYAKSLIASGGYSDALVVLGNIIKFDSGNWRALSAQGIAYDSLGNHMMAEKSFSEALLISPDNPVVMNNLAMSLAQAGNLKKAISTLEMAATINRASQQIRQNLALLYGINGDEEKAKSLAVMDLDPKEVDTNISFYHRFDGVNR